MVFRQPVPMTGPLAPYVVGYRGELARVGYARSSARMLLKLMGRLSCWMQVKGVDVGELSGDVVQDFLGTMREGGGWWQPTARTLDSLLEYLRAAGVVPRPVPPAAVTPTEELIARFMHYLLSERGLAQGTVEHYTNAALLFLSDPVMRERISGAGWTAADVTSFATRQCPSRSVGAAKLLLTGLRSFLRFAHLEGVTTLPLAQAVPSAAGWNGAGMPKALRPGQAAALLAGCDRGREIGRRDYAILVLLVRLGLRAGEVAAITLDDVDWRAGEIVVRGKGSRTERLPLPADVGEAITVYLRGGRPLSQERVVFLRAHAPKRALTPEGVSEVVRAAGERGAYPGSGRTGYATPPGPNCCGPGPPWLRSPRSFGTKMGPRPRCMPRSTRMRWRRWRFRGR
jgi:integrase/recombinase XerD